MDTKGSKYLLEDELPLTKYCSLETKLLISRLMEARKRVEELERDRWIPVSERLPTVGQWVSVIYAGTVQHTAAQLIDTYADGYEWGWANVDADYASLEDITHWRPLPSPSPEVVL